MGKPEATIEELLCSGVIARGGWPAKMIDKGRRGAPDRECRFPDALTIYVETKAPNGHLYSWQERYQEDLRSLGYWVFTIWNTQQLEEFFIGYDNGEYD